MIQQGINHSFKVESIGEMVINKLGDIHPTLDSSERPSSSIDHKLKLEILLWVKRAGWPDTRELNCSNLLLLLNCIASWPRREASQDRLGVPVEGCMDLTQPFLAVVLFLNHRDAPAFVEPHNTVWAWKVGGGIAREGIWATCSQSDRIPQGLYGIPCGMCEMPNRCLALDIILVL